MTRPYRRNPAHIARDAEFARLYRQGQTLAQVGERYGVTREYVRQQLRKMGVSRIEGGSAVHDADKALLREAKRQAKITRRDERLKQKYGLTLAEWRQIGSRARTAFRFQRRTAKDRGIGWELTLSEWWGIWQDSGRWSERGRGKFVMARRNDRGPYAVGNVYICTSSQNIKDSYISRPPHERYRTRIARKEFRGWSIDKSKTGKRYVALFRRKYLGHFQTPDEARATYLAAQAQYLAETSPHA